MNTRDQAINGIVVEFLDSNKKFLFVNGTHEDEKHNLVMNVVLEKYSSINILFRANAKNNAILYLTSFNVNIPSPGKYTSINGNKLYVDSINSTSWNSTPSNMDVAILYPAESLDLNTENSCIKNLVNKNPQKIILITWSDNKDIRWVDQYSPERVTYDAEEENPEYHDRVKKLISETYITEEITNLPQYAQSTPQKYLIQLFCRKCRKGRWAKLNQPYPGKSTIRNADMGTYKAQCLMCGEIALDNYNWYGR